ncbi:MAG: hypothetical protein DWQ02_01485 [Bacteroidetes bacterium]|nr:MAG: hypothetical protein DWQ02_01485 [Bacteroidota bacterium]
MPKKVTVSGSRFQGLLIFKDLGDYDSGTDQPKLQAQTLLHLPADRRKAGFEFYILHFFC